MKWVIGVFEIHNVWVEKNKQKDGNSQNLKGAASDWDVTVGNVTVASHSFLIAIISLVDVKAKAKPGGRWKHLILGFGSPKAIFTNYWYLD